MKRIAALIMGFVLMTVLVAPASAKELVVAHDTNFMPFEFKGPDGKFTGFDIELWETIAKKLGLSYKFQPMDFNGIIPGLQTGNVDVGIAGMTITPERAKVVQFSNGYYTSGLKILVRDDEKGISKVEDLAGKVVAVKTGTSSVPFMKDFGKAKELKQFPNNDGMFFELLSKGVDAVVFDMPVVTAFANSAGKGKAKVVGPLYEGQKYGIGFAQGNEELGRGFQNDRRFEIKSHEAPDGLKEKKGRGGRNLPVALFQRIEAPYISDSLGAKPNHFSYSLA